MIAIREEQPADIAAIREVNRRAFGQQDEGRIVDALRANGGVLLSLVATLGDRVVGHVMFSPVVVSGVVGGGLGPVAVLPEHQRQGIGGGLIQEGIRRLADLDCPFIVVLGHAGYYPRFGFRRASAHGITCHWDVPDEVFMVRILDATRMAGISGVARYRLEFSDEHE
jgi:putative acetyltransferase